MTSRASLCESIDEMWIYALGPTMEMGRRLNSRAGVTNELLSYSATLRNLNYTWLCNPIRKLSPIYACAELLWYLSGEETVERVAAYAPQYAKFANDGIAHGAYGKRWHGQWAALLSVLTKEETRQAVLSCWRPSDLQDAASRKYNDLPCTLTLQFLIRDGGLHLITTMRSNDLWLGFPYDAFAFTTLQRLLATYLKLRPGIYTHQVGSIHVYERDFERVMNAIHNTGGILGRGHNWPCHHDAPIYQLTKEFEIAAWLEEQARTKSQLDADRVAWLHPILRDCVLCASAKWMPIDETLITSPALKEALCADSRRYGCGG